MANQSFLGWKPGEIGWILPLYQGIVGIIGVKYLFPITRGGHGNNLIEAMSIVWKKRNKMLPSQVMTYIHMLNQCLYKYKSLPVHILKILC